MVYALTSLHLWLFSCLAVISMATAQEFVYNGFRDVNLQRDGSANIRSDGLLHLINCSLLQIDHAFYPSPINFTTRQNVDNNCRGLPTNDNGINLDKKPLPCLVWLLNKHRWSLMITARQNVDKNCSGLEEIWLQVLGSIKLSGLKEFLYQEGKLISVSFGTAPTVQLMFSSRMTKSKVEKFIGHILQAFESVLGSSVMIEIRCEAKKDAGVSSQAQLLHHKSHQIGNEIDEIPASPREAKGNEHADL